MAVLCIWTGAAVFIATQRYLRGPSLQPRLALSWGKALAASGVTAAIWALLTPASMRAARRWRPRANAFLGNALCLSAAGVGASLLHLLATTAFWSIADRSGRGPDFLGTVLATLAFGGAARLATFAAIAGVTWGVDDFRAFRDTELRASELDRELVGAQLEALKLRLQPEFLFRALSTIVPLVRHDPAGAARTVVRLGDILRSTLHDDPAALVSVGDELTAIRPYLEIEQTRLPDRLEFTADVDPEAADASVPSLLLLPLCEGAIANGVAQRDRRSRVTIRARVVEDVLRLEVDEAPLDGGGSGSAAAPDESFARRALERLELLYPGRHGVAVTAHPGGGHRVSLWLPYAPASGSALPVRGAA